MGSWGAIRYPLKSGVLGVIGVPESLEASNDAGFSEGTPAEQGPNTSCSEHQSCSAPTSIKRTQAQPFPAGLVVAQRTQQTHSAEQSARIRGAGSSDGDSPQNEVPPRSTRRWVLTPDAEAPDRMLWEWEPWADDDIDELFERVRNRTASEEDHELFDACMLDRFIHRVGTGEPVEPWIMESLANAFTKILFGGEWNDEVRLPGRPVSPIFSWREWRDIEIHREILDCLKNQQVKVVDAISLVADRHAVSYETARAAYYKRSKLLSKK